MKLKKTALFVLLAGVLLLAAGIVSPIVVCHLTLQNGGIGIIGGADAPTLQFLVWNVLGEAPICAILLGAALIVSALPCLLFPKTIRSCCSIRTSAISLGLSVTGGLGLACALLYVSIVAFGKASAYPIETPFSVGVGTICLLVFLYLIGLYFNIRKNVWSWKGLCLDVLTAIIYLPALFWIFVSIIALF